MEIRLTNDDDFTTPGMTGLKKLRKNLVGIYILVGEIPQLAVIQKDGSDISLATLQGKCNAKLNTEQKVADE